MTFVSFVYAFISNSSVVYALPLTPKARALLKHARMIRTSPEYTRTFLEKYGRWNKQYDVLRRHGGDELRKFAWYNRGNDSLVRRLNQIWEKDARNGVAPLLEKETLLSVAAAHPTNGPISKDLFRLEAIIFCGEVAQTQTVIRWDSRSMEEIIEAGGFMPWGDNPAGTWIQRAGSPYDHLKSTGGQFVSTANDLNWRHWNSGAGVGSNNVQGYLMKAFGFDSKNMTRAFSHVKKDYSDFITLGVPASDIDFSNLIKWAPRQ